MDGWQILSWMIVATFCASLGIVALWVLGFIRLAATQSPWAMRLVFLTLAALPFLAHIPFRLQHSAQQRLRAAEVAALPRVVPSFHPDALVAYAHLGDKACVRLLSERSLSEIYVVEGKIAHRFTQAPDGTLTHESLPRDTTVLPDRSWVFLEGRDTNYAEGLVLWFRGNLELRVVDGSSDDLVDYWEDYYQSRPMSILCPIFFPFCWEATHGAEERLTAAEFLLAAIPAE